MATVAQYLEHEVRRGEDVPVADGDPRHGPIIANLLGLVHSAARRKGWLPYAGAQVQVSQTGSSTCPDVAVVGSPVRYVDDRKAALTNPGLIVAVLSASTEDYDRGNQTVHIETLDCDLPFSAIYEDVEFD